MSKRVLVPAADGSEDIELACITNILARAEIKYTLASVMDAKNITLSRGLKLTADVLVKDVLAKDYDAVLLPGGLPGSEHLGKSESLKTIMHEMRDQNKLYGAICAAPVMALGPLGMLDGVHSATCYPSLETKFPPNVKPSLDCVVKCGNCLTSRGPGTAVFFGLAAVALLRSREVAEKIAKDMLLDHYPEMTTVLSL